MKKYIAFLLMLSLTACNKHQSETDVIVEPPPVLSSINIVDRNGLTETINNPDRLEKYAEVDFLQPQSYQKVLRIYTRDAEGNIPACITSYHENGYPSQYLEVINSRACGTYKEWYPNGIQKIEACIIEGIADIIPGAEKSWIFDGCSEVWKESGCIEALIPYCKGDLEGVSVYYHENGQIWKNIPYHKNRIDGIMEIFCEDGMLLLSAGYSQGVKEGESRRYWCEGQLAAEETYCDGLLAFGRYYNPQGECVASINEGRGVKAIFGKLSIIELQEYVNGLQEGEVKVFDACGRINNIYHVKNGVKHGEEIIFYDAGRFQKTLSPKLSVNWYEGKVQGTTKTWYPNGNQESQREMSNNKKNGHSTAWYSNGNLMMIEEYEQDKLLRGEYYSLGEKYPISEVNNGKGVATLYDADGNLIQKITYWNSKPQLDE